MQNTQLQEVLRKLSKQDINKFSDYLNSPYFNKKNVLSTFWEVLKSYAPNFEIDEEEKKVFFKKSFRKEFNAAYYRNICSDMLASLLHFLTIETFEKNETLTFETKVEMLIEFGFYELAEKQLKIVDKINESNKLRYPDKLKHRIWVRDKEATIEIRKWRNKHEEVSKYMYENNNHKLIMDYTLVKSFLLLLNKQRASYSSGRSFDYNEAEKFIWIYESGLHTDDLFVKCYYLMARLRLLNDETVYPELKELIFTRGIDSIGVYLENIIISLLTFLSDKVETDELHWAKEMHEIYDFRMKNELWNMNGSLSYISIFNIVYVALQLNKIKYAEDMIDNYAQYIESNIRKHVTQLCHAYIQFYKGDLKSSHEFLLGIETENILIKYELRTLQSMIYFEQKDFLVLLSYLDSFKHFLAYNKNMIEGSINSNRFKFCNYLLQLTKLETDPNKKHAQKLKEEIEKDSFILKNWMMKQF